MLFIYFQSHLVQTITKLGLLVLEIGFLSDAPHVQT